MFGYVNVHEAELKVKDFKKYKAYYCGLCQMLKEKYGTAGQITLTYDMTFAILLLTSLYECETKGRQLRCVVHPMKKQAMLQNEITEYAADMNLLLAYYHLKDDWEDEKKLSGLLGTKVLQRKVRKAEAKYPRQCKVMVEELKKIQEYEAENCMEIDYPAGCFGRIMEELFLYKVDHWEPTLRKIGFYLGKFIYIMDAYEDLEEDIQKGNYNPLKKEAEKEEYEENIQQMLCMMIGECAAEFEKLPCLWDVDILRNILYDGVWNRYKKIQNKKRGIEDDKESI